MPDPIRASSPSDCPALPCLLLSLMSTDHTNLSASTTVKGYDVSEPEPAPPSAVPKVESISTADSAPNPPINNPPPASTSLPTTTMAEIHQDPDAPSLPERLHPPPHEEEQPTANSVPTISSEPQEAPDDPQVAALKAMFPDFDSAVLQSVLESVHGSQDRAIDMLLGMNDPDYREQEQAPIAQSQTDLDAEFARQLMLEEQSQYQPQQQQGWQSQGQQQQSYYDGYTPYQARVRHRDGGQAASMDPQIGQKDTFTEVQEQFTKIAITGKKTFDSLFTKVKAKLQEFDQGMAAPGGTQPSWGGPEGSSSSYQTQPSYYDPNLPTTEAERLEHQPSIGYNAEPQSRKPTAPSPTPTTPFVATPAPIPEAGPSSPGVASPPTSISGGFIPTSAPPPGPIAPPIDPGKLGMLPKRPVSLLRDPSQPVPKLADDSSDDELEYAENPFEEHK